MYHEAVIVNLLEVIFYNSHIVIENGDYCIDLVDYCMRKLSFLSSYVPPKHQAGAEDFDGKMNELEFGICIAALSVLRYITDCINSLPLSVMERILNRNEVIGALVGLIEKAPWFKKEGTNIMMYENGNWNVTTDGVEHIGKVEGQVWIALYNLLLEPECRKMYQYTTKRYEAVLLLRNYLNESIINQLPIIEGLWRHIEELAIVRPHIETNINRISIEHIPEITQEVHKYFSPGVIEKTLKNIMNSSRTEYTRKLGEVYDLEMLDPVLEDPKCGNCGILAMTRCSRCKLEWYCGRKCQVKAWAKHKVICDLWIKQQN